jgi:hypothetical protein
VVSDLIAIAIVAVFIAASYVVGKSVVAALGGSLFPNADSVGRGIERLVAGYLVLITIAATTVVVKLLAAYIAWSW